MKIEPIEVVAMPKQPTGSLFLPPNLISMARVLPIPLIYLSLKRSLDSLALILLGLALITDAVDGYLARRFQWESKWGLVLDPIADKLLVGSLAVFLVLFRDFPTWAAGLILLRDVFIVGVGVYLYFQPYRVIVPSNRLGKVTTAFMSTTLLLYVVGWQPYSKWLLGVSLAFVVASGAIYIIGFVRLMQYHSRTRRATSSGTSVPPALDAVADSGRNS